MAYIGGDDSLLQVLERGTGNSKFEENVICGFKWNTAFRGWVASASSRRMLASKMELELRLSLAWTNKHQGGLGFIKDE
jgi:hypothetical protein